ncbi:MAG: hypothetical protein KatS3mg101_0543 [Patescibacteria group bacterium]|nr:MAG: hypothetical protein KatS3mg101_0543 [Patescibacteria group bacterium]
MKARLAFSFVLLFSILVVFKPPTVNAANFVLEGGVNTKEQWHSARDGSSLDVVTEFGFYDIVPTVYTEPGLLVTIRVATERGQDPWIGRGTGTFTWNSDGFWEFVVSADETGVVEVVVHMDNVVSLPGKTVYVYAWYADQPTQSWSATISNGDTPLALAGGINTPHGWTSAVIGGNIDVVTENSFDIVGTVYSEPGSDVIMRVVTEKEQDPVITKGTGTFVWSADGYWEFSVVSDPDGVVEIVIHSEVVGPLPGHAVIVSAWYPGQASYFWQATVSNGQRPVSLGGGVNTTEQWYSMQSGSALSIVTANPYDIVPVINTDPGLQITIQVVAEKEQDPLITRGTGSFSWNPDGFWEFVVAADGAGVVEVVIHKNVKPLPGEIITVTARNVQPYVQTWSATISNGMYEVFLPLIVR